MALNRTFLSLLGMLILASGVSFCTGLFVGRAPYGSSQAFTIVYGGTKLRHEYFKMIENGDLRKLSNWLYASVTSDSLALKILLSEEKDQNRRDKIQELLEVIRLMKMQPDSGSSGVTLNSSGAAGAR